MHAEEKNQEINIIIENKIVELPSELPSTYIQKLNENPRDNDLLCHCGFPVSFYKSYLDTKRDNLQPFNNHRCRICGLGCKKPLGCCLMLASPAVLTLYPDAPILLQWTQSWVWMPPSMGINKKSCGEGRVGVVVNQHHLHWSAILERCENSMMVLTDTHIAEGNMKHILWIQKFLSRLLSPSFLFYIVVTQCTITLW